MQLHYTDQGTGVPVVFLHGFCESSFIWEAFVVTLKHNYRVITCDLPGFGKSNQAYENPSISDYAQDVYETLSFLQIEKCMLIGHSLGGYVALAYAKQYPQQLLGLGLFHSTAFADDDLKKNTRTKSIDFIKTHGSQTFVNNMFGNLFSPSKKGTLKAEISSFIEKCSQTPADSIMKTQLAMRDREERIDVLKMLSVPVLFIVGKDDQSVPLAKSMAQVHFPKDAVIHILEDVAHMGMLEAPEQSLKAVRNFISYCEK